MSESFLSITDLGHPGKVRLVSQGLREVVLALDVLAEKLEEAERLDEGEGKGKGKGKARQETDEESGGESE